MPREKEQMNSMSEQTFGEQITVAARYKKVSKLQLIGELLESDRLIRADARQIFALGENVKRYKKALEEIIESEESQSIRSFGLGDIAREALAEPSNATS
jgi:hypothetical protein